MRICIVDSCLRDYTGHHYEYARSIIDECARRGWTSHLVIHREALPEIVQRHHAFPVLHHTIHQIPIGPFARAFRGRLINLAAIVRGNPRYLLELARIPRPVLQDTDLIFFHSVNDRQLLAIAAWFLLRAPRNIRSIVILLRYRPGFTSRKRNFARIAYQIAFRLLGLSRRDVRLATDSDLLAEEYRPLANRPVTVYPIPHAPDHAPGDNAPSGKGLIHLLMPGHSSVSKGLDVLAQAVAAWPDDLKDVRIKVQVSTWIPGDADVVRQLIEGLRQKSFVELIEGSPDSEAFYAMLRAADAILTPYNPSAYGHQTSGIFTEAAAMGQPVITCKGTWMARQIENGLAAGELMDHYTANDFILAVRRLRDHLSRRRAEAMDAALRWRQFHNPRVFLDLMTGRPSSAA